jgi:membrane fusion protein, heavy metal efflux system
MILFKLAFLLTLGGLAACGDQGKNTEASTNKVRNVVGGPMAQSPTAFEPSSIRVSPDISDLVVVKPLETAEVREQIRIVGRLELNGYKTAKIGAPVTGRISEILVLNGQEVRQGEVLAEINSQELTAAQLAFLKAHSTEQLASRAVERAELLFGSDVIGSAELQRRQNEHSVSKSEKRASADQLRVLGISTRSVEQLETTGKLISAAPISATQRGTVIERKIALGQVVQPSDALFVISDLGTLWAAADIPEQEASQVKKGQKVEIEIPALQNARRTGNIVYIADVVNPETRTVRVGVDLNNPEKILKPQMLISMVIDGKTSTQTVVPIGAVVRENDQDHIFIEQSAGPYKLTRVKLGPEKAGQRALLEDLPPGRKVVVDGAFHLNNERIKRNLEKSGKSS